jgi:hypothetical protein
LDGVDGRDGVGSADGAGGGFGDANGFDFAIPDIISMGETENSGNVKVAYFLALASSSMVFSTGTSVSRRWA